MELIEGEIGRHFVGANKLGNVTSIVRGEAFFEGINAVALFGFVRQGLESVKVVTLEFMLCGAFDHVPLD